MTPERLSRPTHLLQAETLLAVSTYCRLAAERPDAWSCGHPAQDACCASGARKAASPVWLRPRSLTGPPVCAASTACLWCQPAIASMSTRQRRSITAHQTRGADRVLPTMPIVHPQCRSSCRALGRARRRTHGSLASSVAGDSPRSGGGDEGVGAGGPSSGGLRRDSSCRSLPGGRSDDDTE